VTKRVEVKGLTSYSVTDARLPLFDFANLRSVANHVAGNHLDPGKF